MALQHIRSSTLDKRPQPASLSDGQLAINTNLNAPGVFFKDSNGALVKVGPTFVGTTAPNSTPGSGGATGNTLGEQWLDTSGGTYVLKIWDGTAWRSEAGEFVNVTGDTMTGALVMDNQQQVRFRETTANGTNYIALQAPASVASDKTITLPDVTGTVVTTGDTGSVTSTMILDGTIVDADISATAEIAVSKLADGIARQLLQTDSAGTGVEWSSNIDIPGTLDVTSAATFDSTIGASAGAAGTPSITFTGDLNTGLWSPAADTIAASTGGSERLRIDSSGRVGIGTTSPSVPLHVRHSGTGTVTTGLWIQDSSTDGNVLAIRTGTGESRIQATWSSTGVDSNLTFYTTTAAGATGERVRIDAAGRLLVGTSSSPSAIPGQYAKLVVQGYTGDTGGAGEFSIQRGQAAASIASGADIGSIRFNDSAGYSFAGISCYADAAPGAGDYPGRLVFSTTADGASSPTERMRVTSTGIFQLASGSYSSNSTWGFAIDSDGTSKILMRSASASGVQLTNGATAWTAFTSESRLKNIVGDVDKNQAWNLVRNVELKRFYYKNQDDQTGVPYMGPMADWLEQQDPELVIYNEPDEDGPIRTFNQAVLDVKALAALQLALERIEQLEAKVAALEAP